MLRASQVFREGSWHERAADTIVLDYDARHRRRIAMTATRGLEFLLDLAEATVLHGGDAVRLDDGRLVEVVAAPEELAEIRCADERGRLAIAWHLGNRHLPVEIVGKKLRIRRDHVIEAMVEGLGGMVLAIEAPFDPEKGAYAGNGDHGHAHHDHAHHDHSHGGHDHHHGHGHHRHDHGA